MLVDNRTLTDHDWLVEAACRGMDTGVFFSESPRHYKEAREVCAMCPVTEECLSIALEMTVHLDTSGLYGGLTPRQRRPLPRTYTYKVGDWL